MSASTQRSGRLLRRLPGRLDPSRVQREEAWRSLKTDVARRAVSQPPPGPLYAHGRPAAPSVGPAAHGRARSAASFTRPAGISAGPKTSFRHLAGPSAPMISSSAHMDLSSAHLGRPQIHMDSSSVHLGRRQIHMASSSAHLGRRQIHLGRASAHMGRSQIHMDASSAHMGRRQIQVGRRTFRRASRPASRPDRALRVDGREIHCTGTATLLPYKSLDYGKETVHGKRTTPDARAEESPVYHPQEGDPPTARSVRASGGGRRHCDARRDLLRSSLLSALTV
jgi:hypothetical protein